MKKIRRRLVKTALITIAVASFFTILGLAGGLEHGYITLVQYIVRSVLSMTILGVSAFFGWLMEV